MDITKINKVEIRNLQREDYDQLASSFTRVYADGSDVFWTPAQIDKLIRIFPEGQIVVVVDDKIVGCALSIIVNYDLVKGDHTYAQVTGNETFDTHTRKGNILYGIEVFIHPDYRGLRLGRRMYEYRKELCEKLNLKAIMFGGRLPNYHKYADRMRPKEYIDKVRKREIYDPVLLFQLSNDFHVRKVMRNYLPNDEESRHFACLLQWDNIYYQAPTEEYVQPKTTVRVGLVQWQMRTYAGRPLRAGRVLRRFGEPLPERLRPLPRVLQRPAHGALQRRRRIAGHPRAGRLYGRHPRTLRRAGHQVQHQHHHGQHALRA